MRIESLRKTVLLLATAILVVVCVLPQGIHARKSPEERARIRQASEEADRDIEFINAEDINTVIRDNEVHLYFFGTTWCPYTQRATPTWLEFQNKVEASGLSSTGFQLAKVDCTDHNEKRSAIPACTVALDIYQFPTVNLYAEGRLIEEYTGEDNVDSMIAYVRSALERYGTVSASSIEDIPIADTNSKTASANTDDDDMEDNSIIKSSHSDAQKRLKLGMGLALGGIAIVSIGAIFMFRRNRQRNYSQLHI